MGVGTQFLYVVFAMTTMSMGVAADDVGVFYQSNYILIPRLDSGLNTYIGKGEQFKVLPDHVWTALGRPVVVAQIAEGASVQRDGLNGFASAFSEIPDLSLESIIQIDVLGKTGSIKRLSSLRELTPVPTPAMQEWAKKVPKTWLMPVPKGVIDTSNGDSWGVISPVVKEGVWRVDVGRQGIYENRPAYENIFCADSSLSQEDALAWSIYYGAVTPIEIENKIIFRKKIHLRADKNVHEYYYVSGRYLISLQVATGIEDRYLKWYAKNYPPTITKDTPLDFAAIALKRLDTMIPLMEQSIGDPVPYLRSSARAYPFDEALFKACQTLPPETPITSYATYNKEREEIHRIWADAQVAETVNLKSYQDRVRAHRESWIGNMRAARTRIAASGLAPTKPTFRLWYTDSPPPRYGDEDVDW